MRRPAVLTALTLLSIPCVPAAATEIRVATWNLEWLFDADDGDNTNQLQRDMTAPSAAEYESRVRGFAAAVAALNPHVLALQEIENTSVVEDVAARLEADHSRGCEVAFVQGNDTYTGQDVAFLVKACARVCSTASLYARRRRTPPAVVKGAPNRP